MTKKQKEALDLFTELIICEADRIKAIKEDGVKPEAYDTTEIEARKQKSKDYKGTFTGIKNELIKDIIDKSLEINNIQFSSKKNYNRLFNIVRKDIFNFL